MSENKLENRLDAIRAAVLTELERLCPNFGDKSLIEGIDGLRIDRYTSGGEILLYTEDYQWEKIIDFRYKAHHREKCWQLAHRLLGLEARDKVEAERSKTAKWENRAWKLLGLAKDASCEAFARTIRIARLESDLHNERAKTAKLVEAEIRNLKSYVDALESTNANNAMNLDHLDAEIERLRPLPQKPREGSTK